MYSIKRILIEAFWGLALGSLILIILRSRGQMKLDNYQTLGILLIPFSILFALYSNFVFLNITLTSFGLACLLLGVTLLTIPSTSINIDEMLATMEGTLVNIEAIMGEFNVNGKAVFLPLNKKIFAFVPLSQNSDTSNIHPINEPSGIKVEINGIPGIFISPPGSELVALSLKEVGIMEIKEALNHVLVNYLEIVESINSIKDRNYVNIELKMPRVSTNFPRVKRNLGSLPSSIAGCVLAYVFDQPVFFRVEEASENKIRGSFEVKSS